MNIHVNTSWNDELSSGINSSSSSGNNQMVSHQSYHTILKSNFIKKMQLMLYCDWLEFDLQE